MRMYALGVCLTVMFCVASVSFGDTLLQDEFTDGVALNNDGTGPDWRDACGYGGAIAESGGNLLVTGTNQWCWAGVTNTGTFDKESEFTAVISSITATGTAGTGGVLTDTYISIADQANSFYNGGVPNSHFSYVAPFGAIDLKIVKLDETMVNDYELQVFCSTGESAWAIITSEFFDWDGTSDLTIKLKLAPNGQNFEVFKNGTSFIVGSIADVGGIAISSSTVSFSLGLRSLMPTGETAGAEFESATVVGRSYIPDAPVKIVEWKFNQTSGTTATDTSGNNFNGVLTGFSGTEWATVGGKAGLSFNSATQSVDKAGITLPSGISNIFAVDGSWTMNVWVYFRSYPTGYGTELGGIGSGGRWDATYRSMEVAVVSNPLDPEQFLNPGLRFNASSGYRVTTGIAPMLNRWNMLTYTYDSYLKNLCIYMNGVPRGTFQNVTFSGVANNTLRVGPAFTSDGFSAFDGVVSNFSVWENAMPANDSNPAAMDVLQLWGSWICVNPDGIADFNKDCITDLSDLATLAEQWLVNTRIYPAL